MHQGWGKGKEGGWVAVRDEAQTHEGKKVTIQTTSNLLRITKTTTL